MRENDKQIYRNLNLCGVQDKARTFRLRAKVDLPRVPGLEARTTHAIVIMDIEEKPKAGANDDATESKKKNKRHRKRFKAIYKPIVKQMEFYFGDANLGKSKFMVEEMENEGAEGRFIAIDVFMKFNKLRGMLASAVGSDNDETEMKEFLWNAVSKTPSDLLDTREDDDGTRWLGRSNVFEARDDAMSDVCTIYVERIPSQMGTVEAIETAFEKYGRVVYVSLPKFKRDGKAKGFAFVQFEKAEEAKKALDSMCDDEGESAVKSMDPGELDSIKSYQEEQMMELKEEQKSNAKKRKSEGVPAATENVSSNSDSGSDDDNDSPPKKKGKSDETEEKTKKKKVRKRKKSACGHVNGNGNAPAPAPPAGDRSNLRVMSKASWKRLRNQYLNEQRKNMSESKKRLRHWREGQDKQHNSKDALLPPPPPPPPPRPSFMELPFVPRTIVKFSLVEPIDDKQMLKKKVRSAFLFPVTYVDADVGKSEYHVRCSDEEQAKKLAGVTCLGNASILTGDEASYMLVVFCRLG